MLDVMASFGNIYKMQRFQATMTGKFSIKILRNSRPFVKMIQIVRVLIIGKMWEMVIFQVSTLKLCQSNTPIKMKVTHMIPINCGGLVIFAMKPAPTVTGKEVGLHWEISATRLWWVLALHSKTLCRRLGKTHREQWVLIWPKLDSLPTPSRHRSNKLWLIHTVAINTVFFLPRMEVLCKDWCKIKLEQSMNASAKSPLHLNPIHLLMKIWWLPTTWFSKDPQIWSCTTWWRLTPVPTRLTIIFWSKWRTTLLSCPTSQ